MGWKISNLFLNYIQINDYFTRYYSANKVFVEIKKKKKRLRRSIALLQPFLFPFFLFFLFPLFFGSTSFLFLFPWLLNSPTLVNTVASKIVENSISFLSLVTLAPKFFVSNIEATNNTTAKLVSAATTKLSFVLSVMRALTLDTEEMLTKNGRSIL